MIFSLQTHTQTLVALAASSNAKRSKVFSLACLSTARLRLCSNSIFPPTPLLSFYLRSLSLSPPTAGFLALMMQLFCQLKFCYIYLNAQAHDPSFSLFHLLVWLATIFLFLRFCILFVYKKIAVFFLCMHAPAELEVISTAGGSSKQMNERLHCWENADRLREILLFAYLRMQKTGKVNNFLRTVVVGGDDKDEMLATMSMWAERKCKFIGN